MSRVRIPPPRPFEIQGFRRKAETFFPPYIALLGLLLLFRSWGGGFRRSPCSLDSVPTTHEVELEVPLFPFGRVLDVAAILCGSAGNRGERWRQNCDKARHQVAAQGPNQGSVHCEAEVRNKGQA